MNYWKRNLYILVICQFLFMGAITMIVPFLPLYLQELGVRGEDKISFWTGLIVGSSFLTAFLFAPFWGKMADKKGRKLMLLRSGFGMALVIGLTGFALDPMTLLLLRLLNGTVAGFIPASVGLVATNTPKEHLGYAQGILQAGAVSGGICGPFFGGFLADIIGFQQIFFVTAIFIFLSAVVVLFFVREDFSPVANKETTSMRSDYKKMISQRPILALCFITFLTQFSVMGINPLVSVFVQELSTGANIAFYAGLSLSVMGLANMITAPLLGKWGDKKGLEYILLFSILGMGLFTIPQVFVNELWQLIMLRFLTGMCLGGILPAINTLIRLHSEAGMESRTYGFSNSAMYLGNLFGPILLGAGVGMIGIRGAFLISIFPLFLSVLLTSFKVLPFQETHLDKEKVG